MSSHSRVAAATLADLPGPIVLLGAGKMGSALIQGWLTLGLPPARLTIVEPSPSPEIVALKGRGARLNERAETAGILVVAIKPQLAAEVLPGVREQVGADTLVVSIMAGRTLKSIAAAFPEGTAIVRAMPNTPAAIGRGITVAVGNAHTGPQGRRQAQRLLEAVGAVEWIDDEVLMDAVTAVSGSGPAYVFLLAEALASAGEAAGLPRDLAIRLARETVSGSGELIRQSELDVATLRKNVTSPGGTTAAALEVLMGADGLPELMQRAIAQASRRSRELAG